MNQFSYLTVNSQLKRKSEIFSPYDTFESLNFQAQKIFSIVDKICLPQITPSQLIQEIKEEILKLLQIWEESIEDRKSLQNFIDNKDLIALSESFSQKQREKDENDDTELEEKFKQLQEQLKKSEESRQRVHSYHQDCLRTLNQEVDEIVHDFKQKFKKAEEIGNILEELFSKEELEQERQVALGKGRESVEIQITKIEEVEGEKWDMGLESEESSGPPADLEGSAMLMYNRLHELKEKLHKFRHEDLDHLDQKENSLNQAFVGSLPISMKSVSSSLSIQFDQILSSLEGSTEKPELQFEFQNELLTLDEKENFIMTLIDKEGTNGKDACLEDMLSVENSEQKVQIEDSSLSFLDQSERAQKIEKKVEEKPLGNSKPDLDIRLSPISTPKNNKKDLIENLSQESSIVMGDNNTSSFISETSFLNDDRKRVKGLKKSEKSVLRRPKISDYDDSNSSIFPPINTSSDDQSFRLPIESKLIRRIPLVPSKPKCAPPQERLNVRGRSLLPIQSSVGSSPKVILPVVEQMNLSSSPNTVNKLRMRRYKEMTRPFVKILNKKLVPREPFL